MHLLTVKIDGKDIDISEKERTRLAISYSSSEINKLDVIKNAVSLTMTIPATRPNKKALGFPEDVNSGSALDQTVKKTIVIEYGVGEPQGSPTCLFVFLVT